MQYLLFNFAKKYVSYMSTSRIYMKKNPNIKYKCLHKFVCMIFNICCYFSLNNFIINDNVTHIYVNYT